MKLSKLKKEIEKAKKDRTLIQARVRAAKAHADTAKRDYRQTKGTLDLARLAAKEAKRAAKSARKVLKEASDELEIAQAAYVKKQRKLTKSAQALKAKAPTKPAKKPAAKSQPSAPIKVAPDSETVGSPTAAS